MNENTTIRKGFRERLIISLRRKREFSNVMYILIIASIALLALWFQDSEIRIALVGFMGALIGGLISSLTNYVNISSQRKTAFQLAALDRRLDAHQEAYRLHQEMIDAYENTAKINEVVSRARIWYNEHCLFLDENSREQFRICLNCANLHSTIMGIVPRSPENSEKNMANKLKIYALGEALQKGVGLPALPSAAENT